MLMIISIIRIFDKSNSFIIKDKKFKRIVDAKDKKHYVKKTVKDADV